MEDFSSSFVESSGQKSLSRHWSLRSINWPEQIWSGKNELEQKFINHKTETLTPEADCFECFLQRNSDVDGAAYSEQMFNFTSSF